VAAIYHFRRYLLLEPNSRESSKVEQLIITAEREILRKLPGEPYGDYLDSLKLKEENDRLTREIADLRARLGLPVSKSSLAAVKPAATTNKPVPVLATPGNIPPIQPARPSGPTQMQTYVVQSGDSLYAISRKFYGDSSRIDLIFEANRDVMRSKNSLSVGQKLRIPPVPLNR
jgi:nucleoid-associated protein YgaU